MLTAHDFSVHLIGIFISISVSNDLWHVFIAAYILLISPMTPQQLQEQTQYFLI